MSPEDLFANIFGKGFRFESNDDVSDSIFGFGAAAEYTMRITFEESVLGVQKEMTVNVTDTCWLCKGQKCAPGTRPTTCLRCRGTGMETLNTGPFIMQTTCRECGGERVTVKNPCRECDGKGRQAQRRQVMVPVPSGVEDGQSVRMNVGLSEIYVTFRVQPSRHFSREGLDIISNVDISATQAMLGGTVRVKGIYEDMSLDIPAGTSSHTRIRLRGKGIQQSYGNGDHYILVKVVVPSRLTEKQRELLVEFAESEANINGTINGVSNKSSYETENPYDASTARSTSSPHQEKNNRQEGFLSSIGRRIKDYFT